MNKPTIEWTCPDGDLEDIVASLINRYKEAAAEARKNRDDEIEYRFGGHFSAYGAFVKNAKYHLGIAEIGALHGKDVRIKGLSDSDAREMEFSIMLFFYNPSPAPLRVLDSA